MPRKTVVIGVAAQRKVLYMDVLILRSHGCEGAVTSPIKGEIIDEKELRT